ncbi:MAG TPA: hypothetical protein VGB00_18490 [Pyrinomonadaceae bacterium]
MKRVFLAAIICFVFQISAFGQTEKPPCPKISVTAPSGIIDPKSGDPATYTASVENSENLQIEYFWETTSGKIISGQGTATIQLLVSETDSSNVAVTIEIKGLPEHCPNKFTETQVIAKREPHNCLDTYGKISRQYEFYEMDRVISQLRQNSDTLVFFYLNFSRKPTQKQVNARILRMLQPFAARKMLGELDRIAFIVAEEKGEFTRICYFLKGQEEIDFNGSNFIKGADVDVTKITRSGKPKK